jgi:ankyrin repeat protein
VFVSFPEQLLMGDESNSEALGEFSRLLDKKDFGKDESVAMSSLQSDGTVKQQPESAPLTSGEIDPLREERIEVGGDRKSLTRFQRLFPRIFEMVARGDHKNLSIFLTNCTAEIHSTDSKGNTALHHAVVLACRKFDSDDKLYKCIDLLMSCEQMNVNMPNKNGYTAIGLAVNNLHRTCIKHMLMHPSFDRLYLDYCPGDRDSTVREIVLDIYPELQVRLPAPLMASLESSNIDKKLLAALQRNIYEVFSQYLSQTNPNPWYDEPYHSSLLEIACQMKDREQFVKLLLNNGADPNIKNRVTGMPLIHATARGGNFEVLEVLLEKEGIDTSLKDNEKRTILHWLAGVNEGTPGDKEKIEKCFKILLQSNYIRKDIDDRDSLGNTPLYITVESGFRDRAKLLLSKGADVRVFESGSKILLSDSLSIVEKILDDCLQHNDKRPTSMDLQLKLNYQSLMNILPRIAESKLHRDLLTHPVMSTFLTIRWENVRCIFFLDMAFYVIFLCFLTVYILLSETYNTQNNEVAASNTTEPFSFNDSNIHRGNVTSQPNSSSLRFLQIFLMILLFLLTVREMQQMILHRWVYVKSLENWLEILLIISTFISCSGVVESAEVKHHSSAIALLLGWLEMLMISGRLPLLSVQHEMLRTVCWTFLRFMAGYVTLLIAFAFSFYILFRGSSEQGGEDMFANPSISLLRTIVMFTGEFDASDLSFDTLPYTSHVIFLLFVVLVAIVLLNLLNGLAVNDTGEIRKDAERLSLASRAKLISRIERLVNVLPKCMKPSVELKEEMFVIFPNRRNRIGSAAIQSLINIIRKKREPNVEDKSTGIQEEWKMFKEKLSELLILQEKLQEKLDSILDI